ncbi:protein RRNAD1-like isoform X3 [Cotesia glomerata]|uniref:protein RRNAD1-like isoform X3 n=1 Tax=Cotesia glomerata TaxID=32391 RepID=UPI001D01C6BF|nr:protein RRNAD1-like isoform X3 [Cotesia glomerata]
MIMCTCDVCLGVRRVVDNIFEILKIHGWILDAYIIDFYQDDLWSKLPSSWRNFFKTISIQELGSWMLDEPQSKKVWPLSLIALKQSIKLLTIDRNPTNDPETKFVCSCAQWNYRKLKNSDFKIPKNDLACRHKNLFTKHIKIKKRYEIDKFSEICAKCCYLANCKCIVDTGAGMGHLARQLSYKYNLSVICVEQTKELSDLANKYDAEYLVTIKKHLPDFNSRSSYHLCAKLCQEDSSNESLIENINEIFESTFGRKSIEEGFGFIGLHPCGDLAVTLLKLYVKQPNVKFITIVGCCYMKLTTRYCELATAKFDDDKKILESDYNCEEVRKHLDRWQEVVAFEALRMMLAPLIEIAVLLDRFLFLSEHHLKPLLRAEFDPRRSPRNFVLVSIK